jgi:hypothetical protein
MAQRDFAKAYEFETPDYRAGNSVGDFAKLYGASVDWHGAEAQRVRCTTPSEALVTITLDFSFPEPAGDGDIRTTGTATEVWIYEDNTWWRSQKKGSLADAELSPSSMAK